MKTRKIHIRNSHIQKTQPPYSAKKQQQKTAETLYGKRGFRKLSISNNIHHKQQKQRKREPECLLPWNGKTFCHWRFKPNSRVHLKLSP
jgi:hypothetical protein